MNNKETNTEEGKKRTKGRRRRKKKESFATIQNRERKWRVSYLDLVLKSSSYFVAENPFIYICIYLFIYYTRTHSLLSGVGTRQRQERTEERKNKGVNRCKKKRIEAQGVPAPQSRQLKRSQEMKNRRREKKKEEAGLQPSYAGPFGRLLRPAGIIR